MTAEANPLGERGLAPLTLIQWRRRVRFRPGRYGRLDIWGEGPRRRENRGRSKGPPANSRDGQTGRHQARLSRWDVLPTSEWWQQPRLASGAPSVVAQYFRQLLIWPSA